MITGKAAIAGVIGFPVTHSLSPIMHNYWIEKHKLDGAYIPLSVAPEGLKTALQALIPMGFKGVNLTIPHKEKAIQWMDELDAQANAIGAVNTVIVTEKGKLKGINTDVYGFVANMQRTVGDMSKYMHRAVVIGAGGAARAVVKGLIDEGAKDIIIVNRTEGRAENLIQHFGKPVSFIPWERRHESLEGAGVVVNTTTQGMHDQSALDISLERLPTESVVVDIVYTPRETPFIATARARGNIVVEGIGMLLHQAVPAFSAWFGVHPEVDTILMNKLTE